MMGTKLISIPFLNVVVILATVFLFLSCASRPVTQPPDVRPPMAVAVPMDRIPSEYRVVIGEAETMLQNGRFREGLRVYEALLGKNPPPIVDSWSRFRMGQILVALEREQSAIPFLEALMADITGEAFEQEAIALLARLYRKLDYDDRLEKLVEMLSDRHVPSSHRLALYRSAAEDAREEGLWSEVLRWHVAMVQEPMERDQYVRIRREIEDIIERRFDGEQLEILALYYKREYPAGFILYRLARFYADQGRYIEAEDRLNEIIEFYSDYPFGEEARVLYDAMVERRKAEIRTLGCVLPLTGRFASYGNKVLDAIILASGVFDSSRRASVHLAVRDSGGDPEQARRAVEDLVNNEGVVAVLGPLESRVALEAAREAQRLRVPIMTLTQREGVTGEGDYVFRHFLTPRLQVEALIEYTMERLGVRRFAILYPDNPYGREMMFRFWHAAASAGASIGGIESYEEDEADFSDHIKRLVRLDGGTASAPRVDFDVLFVPDSALRARLIAPYLEFHDVIGVRLLGMSEWNVPELLEGEVENLEGALFVDVFFRDSYQLEVMDFLDSFYSAFGREADSIEALAFDGAAMIVEGLEHQGVRNRRELRDWLLNLDGYRGVTGRISFDESGEALKSLTILTVQGGRIVEMR